MLSWSSHADGHEVDIAALGSGHAGAARVPYASELLALASAATEPAGRTGVEPIDGARSALAAAAGDEAVVDAAGVIANFEMMTRLADGTGADVADEARSARVELAAAFGVHRSA